MDYPKICIQKTTCVGTQKYFLKKVLQNVWKFKKCLIFAIVILKTIFLP